jgi:hypothetical protein
MANKYHTPLEEVTRIPATGATINAPLAELDTALEAKADLVGGKVPETQLPAYVDEILEYANLAAFPATGATGKIYLALDSGLTYRWSGSIYIGVPSDINDIIEVISKNADDTAQIIYYGDSMTYGTGGNYPYSHWIAAKSYGGQTIVQTTCGLGGAILVDLYDAVVANINDHFAPRSGMNIIVLWGGVNDIFADQGANIPGVLSNLQALASRFRRLGFKVIVCTIPANGGGITYQTYANLIRASWMNFADGMADLAADPIIGLYNSYEVYPTYWDVDTIHMTDLGYQVAAGIIEAEIDRLLLNDGQINHPVLLSGIGPLGGVILGDLNGNVQSLGSFTLPVNTPVTILTSSVSGSWMSGLLMASGGINQIRTGCVLAAITWQKVVSSIGYAHIVNLTTLPVERGFADGTGTLAFAITGSGTDTMALTLTNTGDYEVEVNVILVGVRAYI